MLPSSVSPALRFLQVASSVIFCFFLAGLVFGFAALKPVLLDAGVYADLCDGKSGCAEQDTKLNLLFIVATSTTNCASLPIGWFLDTVGPQIASIVGGAVFAAGTLTFSVGHVGTYIDTYLIGYFLMALGAPALFLSQFHLSNAFPDRAGLILGAITGAFDASSMPLVVFKQVYFALGGRPSLQAFFGCYAIVPILLIVQQLTYAPRELYERLSDEADATVVPSGPETPSTIRAPSPQTPRPLFTSPFNRRSSEMMNSAFSRVSASSVPELQEHLSRRRMSSAFSRVAYNINDDDDDTALAQAVSGTHDPVVGSMFGRSVREQISSRWFWAMEFMTIVHMTRINWYLATVQSQLMYYTKDDVLAERLTDAFTFLLPAAGIAMVPAVGWLLDTRKQRDVALVMMALGVVFGILTLLPYTAAQLVGIAMLVSFRPLFYTAISDYAAKVFGFETFGTVYGLAMTLSGAVGLILNPLDRLIKGPLGGDYTPINIALCVLGAVSSGTLAYQCWPRQGTIKLPNEPEAEE